MYFQPFVILWAAGCRATLLRYPLGTVRTWAGPGVEPDTALPEKESCSKTPLRYQNISCDSVESLTLGPGLIISGQGGSATRAAQKVVQFAGTHAFGSTDDVTGDSCACRWGGAVNGIRRVLIYTGTVDYKVEDLPSEVRDSVEHQTCTTLALLQRKLIDTDSFGKMPWAMKEPWLRVFLPFYTSKLDVKFVHVTRDVRSIHNTHDDETFSWDLSEMEELARLGDSILPKDAIQGALAAGKNTFLNMKSLPDVAEKFPSADIQKFAIFANVWAIIELTLHRFWTSTRPQKYFHISELSMTNETTKKFHARDLANFLGNSDPSETQLEDMMGVYRPELTSRERNYHREMMQAIVEDPASRIVREALTTFGYTI